jgi:hypothetical protein
MDFKNLKKKSANQKSRNFCQTFVISKKKTIPWPMVADPGGKKWHTKIEKSTEFSCFEVLDVHFWGLKASPVAWASFMEA